MGRVRGESGASASSTNSYGTTLRGLILKEASSGGKNDRFRRGLNMPLMIVDFPA